MLNKCHREVKELHQFFEGWFTAQIPHVDKMLERVSTVLSDDFQLITPEGHLLTRDDLLEQLKKSYGSQADRDKYKIEVTNFDGRALAEDGVIFLTTYQENQYINDEHNIRLSSSLFRSKPDTPNQVEWIHVHEVWL